MGLLIIIRGMGTAKMELMVAEASLVKGLLISETIIIEF